MGTTDHFARVMATGSPNKTFLYFANSSGPLNGSVTRPGDEHNMMTLQQFDCLPRLVDAAACPDGPEVHMVRSWLDRLSQERLQAEQWLGYSPERQRRLWVSPGASSPNDDKLF